MLRQEQELQKENKAGKHTRKQTSEEDTWAPWVGAAGWKATSLPPKPKDAPVGHFNHFGAGALGRAEYIFYWSSDKSYERWYVQHYS
jgi:hypothetical protein